MTTIRYANPDGKEVLFGDETLRIIWVKGLEAPPLVVNATAGALQEGLIALNVLRGPRRISIKAMLALEGLEEAEAQQLRQGITEALSGSTGEGVMTVTRNARTRRIRAMPASTPAFAPKKWNEGWQEILSEFICPNPCFLDMDSTSERITYYASLLTFAAEGIEFPEDGIEFSTIEHTGTRTQKIMNGGNHETPVLIRFSGPSLNPFIRNLTTGETMRILGALQANEYMEINTEPGSRKIRLFQNGEESNGMHFLDLSSKFWQLEPGENMVEIGDESPGEGSEAAFEFYGRHLDA
jgi:hypothetical protein